MQEGRWKQLPGNEGLKRFFKPKRKPTEKEKPPQHEGEDADDEALDADETEPMWGDEALAIIDGNDENPVDNDADQEPSGGSDDPAVEESGGNEQNPVQDHWERSGKYIYRVHVVPRTTCFAPTLCEDEPPVPLENIEVYRTSMPDEFYQIPPVEDTWIGHKK